MNKRVLPTSAGESNGAANNDHHILKCNADTASVAIISLTAFIALNFIAHTAFCDA
jgi:hypothetical protein